MVLFVPEGVDEEIDPTRNHIYYDAIYGYLKSCGIQDLDTLSDSPSILQK